MKYLKPTLIIIAVTVLSLMVYVWITREEWTTRKKCADCETLTNQEQQRLIGTVEILPNGETIFTDQMVGLKYKLVSCDANCETKELMSFSKIGVKDFPTKEQIYFDIEGKYIPEKDEFVYSFIIVLNQRKFVNTEEIKDLAFDKIQEKYTALKQETFPLNESHYAGLREFLPHYFTEKQLKQPIPIKEATYETSDSTLITIWFEQKPTKKNKWIPIEKYEWKKGTDF
ncbi:hypothetical protein ACLH3R_002357 [Flavobacterium psychrophilum]